MVIFSVPAPVPAFVTLRAQLAAMILAAYEQACGRAVRKPTILRCSAVSQPCATLVVRQSKRPCGGGVPEHAGGDGAAGSVWPLRMKGDDGRTEQAVLIVVLLLPLKRQCVRREGVWGGGRQASDA